MAWRVASALHLSHDNDFLEQFNSGFEWWLRSSVGYPIKVISSLFSFSSEKGGEPDLEGLAAGIVLTMPGSCRLL